MTHNHPPPEVEGERARAVKRLNEAVAERNHLRELQTKAKGTSRQAAAATLLRAADEHVVARERWLKRVDEPAGLMP